jgi:hypothetical protein
MARDKVRISPIPDCDHLMRLVPHKQQIRDPDTDVFIGIVNTAFSLRTSDKGGLSTQWVEYFGEKSLPTYSSAAERYRDNLPSKRIGSLAYFAIGNVGMVKLAASEAKKRIRVVHEPDGTNEGHAVIRRFTDDDRALLDVLAIEVFAEHVWVGDLDLN